MDFNIVQSASYSGVRKNYCAVVAARCCQYAMKVSRLAGVLAAMPSENGARMPSTADDVFAEIRSAALRLASVLQRRYGLDSLSVMRHWYYAQINKGVSIAVDVRGQLDTAKSLCF